MDKVILKTEKGEIVTFKLLSNGHIQINGDEIVNSIYKREGEYSYSDLIDFLNKAIDIQMEMFNSTMKNKKTKEYTNVKV